MKEVPIATLTVEDVEHAVGADRFGEFATATAESRKRLGRTTVWHINSTAQGGGVAEMLVRLLAYARGLDMEMRWVVIEGDPGFFEITKRLHNNLHGHAGDGGDLGQEERTHYEMTLAGNAKPLTQAIRPGDIVVCHDPQTAGLVPMLCNHGARVVWRCHIGADAFNSCVTKAWDFLAPYLEQSQKYIFTRKAYCPPQLDESKCVVIAPSIDPMSCKNQPMSQDDALAVLIKAGIVEGRNGNGSATFMREDGSRAAVQHAADMIHLGRAPRHDRPLIVQVSRWDGLKDPVGVMRGFAHHLANENASLVLAGPNVSAVADDPEGRQILTDVETEWRELPHEVRKHVHLACLPMSDREENAAIVNALQRHAAIIVQKSLNEGFGLTVTEGMWKGKPMVASRVGGIQDQIQHEVNGLLVDDPTDLRAYGESLIRYLHDPDFAAKMGERAHNTVAEKFLFTRHLRQYLEVFDELQPVAKVGAA